MLQQIGIVALGGALGAALRYAASELIATESFPYATLSVNLVGSFLLGIVAVALTQNLLSTNLALLLGTGVLGAFTTMSTFSVETIEMFEQGQSNSAILYILVTMLFSPLLAFLGWRLAQSVLA